MKSELNLFRDSEYLSSRKGLIREINTKGPNTNIEFEILAERYRRYEFEFKNSLLPQEELEIQFGSILSGIEYMQSLDIETLPKDGSRKLIQFQRVADRLYVPFDPFLHSGIEIEEIEYPYQYKREWARLNLLKLAIESLGDYRQICEEHLDKLNNSNLRGKESEYIDSYWEILSKTEGIIDKLEAWAVKLHGQFQLINLDELPEDKNNLFSPELLRLYDSVGELNWLSVVEWLEKMRGSKQVVANFKAEREMILFEGQINSLRKQYSSYVISDCTAQLSLVRIFNDLLNSTGDLLSLPVE